MFRISKILIITSITLESATEFGTILRDEYKRTSVLQIVPWHTGAIVYDFRSNFRNVESLYLVHSYAIRFIFGGYPNGLLRYCYFHVCPDYLFHETSFVDGRLCIFDAAPILCETFRATIYYLLTGISQ